MERIAASELIINGDGSVFHLHIRPEALADTVILVGDPGRVGLVKEFLYDIEAESSSREFCSVTGYYNGKRITVLSTGIGCDNIDIVMNELDALANIDFSTKEVREEKRSLTVLRIGTCGIIQEDIPLGSIIFSEISVGFDGLLNWYADRDAVVEKDLEEAFLAKVHWDPRLPVPYFVRASEELSERFSCPGIVKGMTVSASGFYGPQCRVLRLPLALPNLMEELVAFEHNGYRFTNFEMEGSAIASLARKLGHKAATVCLGIAHRYEKQANSNYKAMITEPVKVCLDRLTE